MPSAKSPTRRVSTYKIVQAVLGILFAGYLLWRIYVVFIGSPTYGADTWARFIIAGVVLGSVYALIAIGYTLVYGILRMINFAHGDIMMIGAFGGYFVFEAFKAIPAPTLANPKLTFLDANPILSVVTAFIVGASVAALGGYFLEKIAYRPLRGAPRLVPLISAIGASIFLENAGQLLFGTQRRDFSNPVILTRGNGWNLPIGGTTVILPYTGVLTVAVSVLLMIGLYLLVMRTRLGRSMRAVAENKQVAALMGIDVDAVISRTFIISGALAGAAGVMWGIHLGLVYYYVGFLPGIKAFTAAVMGGIGNLTGALLGGMVLGMLETFVGAYLSVFTMGAAGSEYKDILAFAILILVLIFRPSGLLGEQVAQKA